MIDPPVPGAAAPTPHPGETVGAGAPRHPGCAPAEAAALARATAQPDDRIIVIQADKTFVLHAQMSLRSEAGRVGGRIPVLRGAALRVRAGECVALAGPSGAGKSTLLRILYGNYRSQAGCVCIRHWSADGARLIDVASADPHDILELRRVTVGYVSQFLRVIPRVSALDIVAEPLVAIGRPREAARARAAELLRRLNVREELWPLSPLTFSGGEQQRVNIARGFAHAFPVMLLDEPTASLDRVNREIVLEIIAEAKAAGAAMVGIFHDAEARARVADREIDVSAFAADPA